jgi:hypothetical protein
MMIFALAITRATIFGSGWGTPATPEDAIKHIEETIDVSKQYVDVVDVKLINTSSSEYKSCNPYSGVLIYKILDK